MRRARWVCALTAAAIAGTVLVTAHAGAGGGCHGAAMGKTTAARLPSGEGGSAFIAECAFEPTVLYVDPGAEVTWINKDLFDHTVTGANLGWGSEAFLAQGDTITQRFNDEGVFPFFCLLHPGMVGAVVVGDPDPDDVTTSLSTIDSSGIEIGSEAGGAADAAAPDTAPARSDAPPSDSLPSSVLLGTLALLVLAAAIGYSLVRRRARLEHGA